MLFSLCILLLSLAHSILGSPVLSYAKHSPKAVGMGAAYTAYAQGSDAIFYNWAYQHETPHSSWTLSQSSSVESPYYTISIDSPLNRHFLRLGILYSAVENIPYSELNNANQPVLTGNTFNQRLAMLYGSHSHDMAGFDVGVRHMLYTEQLATERAFSYQLDIAAHHRLQLFSQELLLGATVQNISNASVRWSTNQKDKVGRVLTAGIASSFLEERLLLAADFERHTAHNDSRLYYGLQYYFVGTEFTKPSAALRLGNKNSQFCAGVGLNIDGWLFDYSWAYSTDISSVDNRQSLNEHLFSIGRTLFPLTKFVPKEKEKPPLKLDTILPPIPKKSQKYASQYIVSEHLPALLYSATFSASKDYSYCHFSQKSSSEDLGSMLNNTTVPNSEEFSTSFPVKWILRNDTTSTALIMDLDRNGSDSLILSGHLPNSLSLLVNHREIQVSPQTGAFYTKIPFKSDSTLLELDIALIERKSL